MQVTADSVVDTYHHRTELGRKLMSLRRAYVDGGGNLFNCNELDAEIWMVEQETEVLVQVLRGRLANMTDDERVELMSVLMDGYCKHCGTPAINVTCYCMNDE